MQAKREANTIKEFITIIIAPNPRSLQHSEKGDEMKVNIHIMVEGRGYA